MKIVKALSLLLLFSSCQETYFQDDRLLYFAEKVQSQLAERGVEIKLHVNLILKEGIKEDYKAYGVSMGEDIFIDLENFEWALNAKYECRIEALIAHEIGHNLLDLRHFEKENKNEYSGKPVIMIPGTWQRIKPDNLSDMYDVLAKLSTNGLNS